MSNSENPACVYLVYCDSALTGLGDPPTLERIFLSREKAEAYLAKNPRPGNSQLPLSKGRGLQDL